MIENFSGEDIRPKRRYPRRLNELELGQAVLSPYEVFDSLLDPYSLTNIGLQLGEDIVHQILFPYESDIPDEDFYDVNLVVFMGEPGGSKTIASRQCLLKTLANRKLQYKLHNLRDPRGQRRRLTGVLVRRDDYLMMVRGLLGIKSGDKTPLVAQVLASYATERSIYWLRDNLSHPLLIVAEMTGLSLPGRDLGWDVLDTLTQYRNVKSKVAAILPKQKIQVEAFWERKTLEDQAMDLGQVKTTARQKEIEYRESMSTAEAIKRTQELVFQRVEQLIKQKELPAELEGFRGNPEKEREARKAFYRLHGEQLSGLSRNDFYLVEGVWFDEKVDIHRYDDIFDKFPNRYSPLVPGLVDDIIKFYKLEVMRNR